MHAFTDLSNYLFVHWSLHPLIYPSFQLFVSLPTGPLIHPFIGLPNLPSMSIVLSIHPSSFQMTNQPTLVDSPVTGRQSEEVGIKDARDVVPTLWGLSVSRKT